MARQPIVHEEWVDRPAAFVIDRDGLLRQARVGRGFNDRVTADHHVADVSALS